MKNFLDFLNKYANHITLFICVLGFFNTCNISRNASKVASAKKDVATQIDSSMKKYEDRILMQMEIQGLKAEKSTLLNTNQIFLTKKRPDERVIEIDAQITELERKLQAK